MLQLYPKNEREWQGAFIRILIVGFIVLQLAFWLIFPRVSNGHPTARVSRTIHDHEPGPKSELYEVIVEARRQDVVRADRLATAESTILIIVDITLIYLFWDVGSQKRVA